MRDAFAQPDVNYQLMVAPWRRKVASSSVLVIGILAIAAGMAGIYAEIQSNRDRAAFHAALACEAAQSASKSPRCKFTGPATITGTHRDVRIFIDLTFAALPGRTFTTSFSTKREPPSSVVKVGSTESAQLWDGKVTTFGSVGTADDPDYETQGQIPGALVFVVVGLALAIYSAFLVREAWRR